MALKDDLPTMFCTPLDVRNANEALRATTMSGLLHIEDGKIGAFILKATGIIKGSLAQWYVGDAAFETTPYCSPPQRPIPDENNSGHNSGSSYLLGSTVASTAVTELWTVEFTSEAAFTVTGSRSGNQGTGSTASTFTSTNLDISIPATYWTAGEHMPGDKHYIATYSNYEMVVAICTFLAAGMLNMAIYTEQAPNENNVGRQLYDRGMDLLNSLKSGDNAQLPGFSQGDLSDAQVFYEVDPFGRDTTGYKADEYQRYIGSSALLTTTGPWWWYA